MHSIGVHLNSASFDSPADQLNKLEEKSKEINPDFRNVTKQERATSKGNNFKSDLVNL